ncbi:hypothetical protein SLE2022_136030 [Rubroshorea leprosula]
MANPHYQSAPVIVVAVPFPAQSHLNQMLQLSCLLSSCYNLPVHYVGSSIHIRQAKLRCSTPLLLTRIQFRDLPIPPFPSPFPIRGGDTDFPAHLQPSFDSSLNLREPLAALIDTLSSQAKKVVVIHDPLMAFAVQDAVSFPNVELYILHTSSAFTSFSIMWERTQEVSVPKYFPENLPSMEGCLTNEVVNLITIHREFTKLRSGDLHNTCRVIEGEYIDHLAQNDSRVIEGKYLDHLAQNDKLRTRWAVGPLSHHLGGRIEEQSNSSGENICLIWLDKQPPKSVIYISFGTTSSFVKEQIKELAVGIEESKIKFIWVLRYADRGDVFAEEDQSPELPEGFEERTEGEGMVVRGWVPQAEILKHPSTGGFLSHCGWGSCLESISSGVPIAAWPMHSDQPRNATLVTQVLKIGLIVREWSHREELITASAIKEALRTLMASEEGEMMRKRAQELGRAVRQAAEEGGISRKELESFISHITR